ncbi:MAG: histidine kinase [Pseudomonadota bacterium]
MLSIRRHGQRCYANCSFAWVGISGARPGRASLSRTMSYARFPACYRRPALSLLLVLFALFFGRGPHAAELRYPQACVQQMGAEQIDVRWRDVRERELQTLECDIELPAVYAGGEPIGLFLSGTFSARISWDGVALGSKGSPGLDRVSEVPGPLAAVVFVPPELLGAGRHRLSIEWSAHHAGNVYSPLDFIFLGPFQDPLYAERARYLPAMLTAGTLVLAFTYLLLLGLRTRDRASCWLAAACFAVLMQLAFEVLRAYVNYSYDWHAIRLRAVTVAAGIATMCLLAYLCQRFERRSWWIWAVVPIGVLSAWLVPSPDGATVIVITLGLLAGIIVTAQARLGGDTSAQPAIFGLVLFVALLLLNAPGFLDLGLYLGYAVLLLFLFAEQVGVVSREREAKQQAELTSARLRTELLKRNLNPHFLMNTLTTLSEWIEISPRTGVAMINALSEEFRHLAQMAEQTLVPLAQEIALCQRHLEVMGYRHDRRYALAVEGSAADWTLPPAVVHTLVENAITHGRYAGDTALSLKIEASAEMLTLTLTAPAGKPTADHATRKGTGTRYVEARLAEAYGDAWSLEAGPTEDGGWRTRLCLPARRP